MIVLRNPDKLSTCLVGRKNMTVVTGSSHIIACYSKLLYRTTTPVTNNVLLGIDYTEYPCMRAVVSPGWTQHSIRLGDITAPRDVYSERSFSTKRIIN